MEAILYSDKTSALQTFEEDDEDHQRTQRIIASITAILHPDKAWITRHFYHYQSFWYNTNTLKGVMLIQQHFKPKSIDILLSTIPKAGTTWLKALCFALAKRSHFRNSSHPLLTTNPHECVPFLEMSTDQFTTNPDPNLAIVATHIPYMSLPKLILDSNSRIVYMVRDPKDVFVSLWHFMGKITPKDLAPLSLEESFLLFSKGVSPYGPFWDHVLGYWKASLELPRKVFFLKFEDMKNEPFVWLKRLAEFLGFPFSVNEEQEGVVEEIVNLCSFDNLSNLEVNKNGIQSTGTQMVIENSIYFRQGMAGDWKNHLSTEMAEHLDRITEQKFKGTGLTLSSL
ncbi:hypothetical protein LguiB_030070 [Lonicera macranthoides]